jgi:arabinogalactan oligomer / maltooligosaccharide transport system substrate-binding protein
MIKLRLVALFALALLLVACPSGNSGSSGSTARVQIAVEPSYVAYFEEMTKRFSEGRSDVEFTVVPVGMFDVLDSLAINRGNSADIFMIVNDRIGNLADQRLIEPLSFGVNGYTTNAVTAGTYQDSLYFVPMSTDTTLLIYNADRISAPPTYLSQIPAARFAAKFTDFYFTAGMLSTKGGYIFGNDGGLGLANAGSIEAGRIIQGLYNSGSTHWSAMKDDTVAYDVMMNALSNGDVDYIINGPWALNDILSAGVNAKVAPIPSWDGSHPYRALAGVKGMGVNAYSSSKAISKEFLQFLATQAHAQLWFEMTQEVAPHNGVTYPEGSLQAISFDASAQGQAMPTDPAFGTVWDPMRTALVQIANNENVDAAFNAAADRITRDIADLRNN